MEVCHLDNYTLYEDGDHDVFCEDCGHEFMVTTYVSYSFCSPGLRDTPRDSRGRFVVVSENF